MNTFKRPVKRVAVIGAGYFSQFHLHGWAAMPGVEIVAICDADLEKATSRAKQFNAACALAHAEELFAIADIDLLDMVTPPASHWNLVAQAMAKGIPTICQKPFGQNYKQAVVLVNIAEQAGVPLIVHENFRFMPWYREMRRHLDAGLLGAIHGVAFRLRPGDGQGSDAYLSRQPYFQKLSRFLVMETAVHFIDTFRYLCGEVSAVYAHLRRLNPAIAGEDAGLIHFEFASGAAGYFDGNRLNDHVADNPRRTMGEMWLEGERGVLRLDGNAHLFFKPHHGSEQALTYDRGHDLQFGSGACAALQQHIVECFATGQRPENTASDYLRNLLIQEAVYASHAQGRRIAIDTFDPPTSALALFATSTIS
ncbi:MAG: Gfo/Idh/MocA family oxidoreductase [Brachymonas sp.]|nr:Gfo/Idh/MocA family oxidoreductase [Brachymonas sp.]